MPKNISEFNAVYNGQGYKHLNGKSCYWKTRGKI